MISVRSLLLVLFLALTAAPPTLAAGNPLPSWNEGPARQSIADFVAKVTKKGSPDFIPPAERIAVFDNDRTLWVEQPFYFQGLFILDRVRELAPRHPKFNRPYTELVYQPTHCRLRQFRRRFADAVMDNGRAWSPLRTDRPPRRQKTGVRL